MTPSTCRAAARPTSASWIRASWVFICALCGLSANVSCSRASTAQPKSSPAAADGNESEAACPEFTVQRGGPCTDVAVKETSGIAFSSAIPSALWAHNDSGDRPRLFAIGFDGTVHGEVALKGATAVDWEDMSAAPGSYGSPRDLIVGDVGDNEKARDTVQLYRFAEPRFDDLGTRVAVRRFDLRFPDGPQDVEALFVDPMDGAVYLVSKRPGRAAALYRVILSSEPSSTLVADLVGTIPISFATAADMSDDGSRLVIRSYHSALLWERAEGSSIAQTVKRHPCPVALPTEPQGEAIAFADVQTLLLLSERSSQPVYVLTQRGSTRSVLP